MTNKRMLLLLDAVFHQRPDTIVDLLSHGARLQKQPPLAEVPAYLYK